jgi:hypothetical protein
MLPGYSGHTADFFAFGDNPFLEIQVILFPCRDVPLRLGFIIE